MLKQNFLCTECKTIKLILCFSDVNPPSPVFTETRNYTIGEEMERHQIFGYKDRERIQLMQEHLEAQRRNMKNTEERQAAAVYRKTEVRSKTQQGKGVAIFYGPWHGGRWHVSGVREKGSDQFTIEPVTTYFSS